MNSMIARAKHCQRRAKQRYGVKLRIKDWFRLSEDIRYLRSNVTPVVYLDPRPDEEYKEDEASVYRVEFRDTELLAIWDEPTGQIKTFLPPDAYVWDSKNRDSDG